MTARAMLMVGLVAAMAGLLVGCGPAPQVEFATPRVTMHVQGEKILDVQKVRGDVTIDNAAAPKFYRVVGTGEVRVIMDKDLLDTHTVFIDKDKIRVHGKDVPSQGAMRHVAVRKGIGTKDDDVRLDKINP